MSLLWFLFLMYAYGRGAKDLELPFIMIAIFYIGDCILMLKSDLTYELKQLKKEQ